MHPDRLKLDDDEHVLFMVRKHWFILAVEIVSVIGIALIPIFFYGFMRGFAKTDTQVDTYFGFFIALYSLWLIFSWMALFSIWTNYYLDVWTLTNKRLIAVDQHGLFSRTTASFRLERLQDVIISIHGLLPTLFKFGTVEIQTAGEERNFKVFGLPNPEAIKAAILDASGTVHTPMKDTAQAGV